MHVYTHDDICDMHHPVYSKQGYREVIDIVAEDSMRAAAEEAKAQPSYDSAGEVSARECLAQLLSYVQCIYCSG